MNLMIAHVLVSWHDQTPKKDSRDGGLAVTGACLLALFVMVAAMLPLPAAADRQPLQVSSATVGDGIAAAREGRFHPESQKEHWKGEPGSGGDEPIKARGRLSVV